MLKLTGDWDQLGRLLGALQGPNKKKFDKCVLNGLHIAGYQALAEIRKAIRGREFAPNAPATLRAKTPKDIPLIDTGQLMRALTVKPITGKVAIFVGIWKTKQYQTPDGTVKMANIARALHQGVTIQTSRAVIRIPARPFIQQPIEGDRFTSWYEQHLFTTLSQCLKQAGVQ